MVHRSYDCCLVNAAAYGHIVLFLFLTNYNPGRLKRLATETRFRPVTVLIRTRATFKDILVLGE
jgi:hypothetical protein